MYLVLTYITVLVSQYGLTKASDFAPFYCHGDICNMEQREQFCDEVDKRCRSCFEVLYTCFTRDMPQNCSKPCLSHRDKIILKEVQDKPCTVLKKIKHGNHNGSQSNQHIQGTIIQFTCDNGYRLTGYNISQCIGYGQWSNLPPVCEEVFCPVLLAMENGKHNGSARPLSPGSVVVSTCNDDSQLYGQNVTTCSQNGHWSNDLPTCEPFRCAHAPAIRNGRWLQLQQSRKQFVQGEVLHAQCNKGFQIYGPILVTCYEGFWQSNDSFIPICLKEGHSSKINSTLLIVVICLASLLCVCFIVIGCAYVMFKRTRNVPNKYDKKDIEANIDSSISEEKQSFLDNEAERNDSLGNVSRFGGLGSVLNAQQQVNITGCQPEVNIVNTDTVIFYDNTKTTPGRNDGEVKTSTNVDGTNPPPQTERSVSYETNKMPVEEAGDSLQPGLFDTFDSNAPLQPEELPNDVFRQESDDLPNDIEPTIQDESLNLEPLGGTEPMKSMSGDSLSAVHPTEAVGTHPLKPEDGYRYQQDAQSECKSGDLCNRESDGEGRDPFLRPRSQSSLDTVDQTFLKDNSSDNNL